MLRALHVSQCLTHDPGHAVSLCKDHWKVVLAGTHVVAHLYAGQQALAAVARATDGRGERTALEARLGAHCGVQRPGDLLRCAAVTFLAHHGLHVAPRNRCCHGPVAVSIRVILPRRVSNMSRLWCSILYKLASLLHGIPAWWCCFITARIFTQQCRAT